MKIRKITDTKLKVLLIQGSPRDPGTCPGMAGKTHKILDHIKDKYSNFFDFKIVDIAVNQQKRAIIQPCKGCVSTAGGYHCHWKCSCYKPNDNKKPDLMFDQEIYSKLEWCDIFIVFTPIHWHSASSQVKSMFDRLVCANLTLTKEEAIDLMGKGNIKKPQVTGELAKSGQYKDLLKNHLEGKYAAFFAHGDNGANDYDGKALPESYIEEDSVNPIETIMPFVRQCRYSGIYVPDEFVEAFYMNQGLDYYTANEILDQSLLPFMRAESLINRILQHFENKNNI